MPQLQTTSPGHSEPAIPAKPDNPMCPACQRAMALKQVMPSISMIGVGETVYACDACGTETHRTAKLL